MKTSSIIQFEDCVTWGLDLCEYWLEIIATGAFNSVCNDVFLIYCEELCVTFNTGVVVHGAWVCVWLHNLPHSEVCETVTWWKPYYACDFKEWHLLFLNDDYLWTNQKFVVLWTSELILKSMVKRAWGWKLWITHRKRQRQFKLMKSTNIRVFKGGDLAAIDRKNERWRSSFTMGFIPHLLRKWSFMGLYTPTFHIYIDA